MEIIMNDKEIILETLNHIKHVRGFKDIKTYWDTLNVNEENQIKNKTRR